MDADGLVFQEPKKPVVKVWGSLTENVHFNNSDFKVASRQIIKGNQAGAKVYTIKINIYSWTFN